jgi:hypothetical protein
MHTMHMHTTQVQILQKLLQAVTLQALRSLKPLLTLAVLPLLTIWSKYSLASARCSMRSSTLLLVMRRYTCTGLVWPMRCTRAMACRTSVQSDFLCMYVLASRQKKNDTSREGHAVTNGAFRTCMHMCMPILRCICPGYELSSMLHVSA